MNRLAAVLLILLSIFTNASVQSAPVPVIGTASFYDPSGNLFIEFDPIIGELDRAAGTGTFEPFSFFGFNFTASSVELLEEGTHTRPVYPSGSQTMTVSVGPGQLGAYIVLNWSVNEFATFMVWDVSSHPGGTSYTVADSDGDGVPGHALVGGPFAGVSIAYDLIEGEPPPGVEVTLNATGGLIQECSEQGGSTVQFSADIKLIGSAVLGSVEWFVDGVSAGSGTTITPFLALGPHTVEVQASITSGASDSDTADVDVRDTTDPSLDIAFLDQAGTPVTSIDAGRHVSVSIAASDICDPAPTVDSAATPVFEVRDGDSIKIQQGSINSVVLPTTAIELSATANDVSGNSTSATAVLSITD